MKDVRIGVIGGSGLYEMEEISLQEEVELDTPFGPPSDSLVIGSLDEVRIAFLARHGRGHRLLPSELNFRANIYAMKMLGVERILSASAVGSLKQECRPLDIVLRDQFFDRTRGRNLDVLCRRVGSTCFVWRPSMFGVARHKPNARRLRLGWR